MKMLLLVLCRVARIAPRRYCLACGEETMRTWAPVRQSVLGPLGLGLRTCRRCRRRWVAPGKGADVRKCESALRGNASVAVSRFPAP